MAFIPLMLYRERAHIVSVTPVASSQDAFHGSRAAIVSQFSHCDILYHNAIFLRK